jgi:hypothetical protein
MKLTLNQAAQSIGVNKSTMHRHIERKRISVDKDDEGRILIDASEMIRIYGDKFKPQTLQDVAKQEDATPCNDEDNSKVQPIHNGEVVAKALHDATLQALEKENQLLRDRIRDLEEIKQDSRKRESDLMELMKGQQVRLLTYENKNQEEEPVKSKKSFFGRLLHS